MTIKRANAAIVSPLAKRQKTAREPETKREIPAWIIVIPPIEMYPAEEGEPLLQVSADDLAIGLQLVLYAVGTQIANCSNQMR